MEVSGKSHAPTALSPGKNAGTLGVWDWVGPTADPNCFWRRENLLPLPEFEARTLVINNWPNWTELSFYHMWKIKSYRL